MMQSDARGETKRKVRAFWSVNVREPVLRARIGLPWLGPVITSLVLALLVNVLTTTLTTCSMWLAWGIVFLAIALVVVVVIVFNLVHVQRRLQPTGDPHPRKHRGLVFLFSRKESLEAAVRHHYPTLERCWLIVTPEKEAEAIKAIQELMDEVPRLEFTRRHLDHMNDTEGCYKLIRDAFNKEAPNDGISPIQVIGDITGATKPMATGMMRACLEGAYHMQYIPVELDPESGVVLRSLPPIWIRTR